MLGTLIKGCSTFSVYQRITWIMAFGGCLNERNFDMQQYTHLRTSHSSSEATSNAPIGNIPLPGQMPYH